MIGNGGSRKMRRRKRICSGEIVSISKKLESYSHNGYIHEKGTRARVVFPIGGSRILAEIKVFDPKSGEDAWFETFELESSDFERCSRI